MNVRARPGAFLNGQSACLQLSRIPTLIINHYAIIFSMFYQECVLQN